MLAKRLSLEAEGQRSEQPVVVAQTDLSEATPVDIRVSRPLATCPVVQSASVLALSPRGSKRVEAENEARVPESSGQMTMPKDTESETVVVFKELLRMQEGIFHMLEKLTRCLEGKFEASMPANKVENEACEELRPLSLPLNVAPLVSEGRNSERGTQQVLELATPTLRPVKAQPQMEAEKDGCELEAMSEQTLLAGQPVPPNPSPLFYVPVRVAENICWALLDSGAADNFISQQAVAALELRTHPLPQPMSVCVGNGAIIYATRFVQLPLMLGDFKATTYLKVLPTPIPMVLGYTFLLRHQPQVDWAQRMLTFSRRGKTFVVKGHPEPDLELTGKRPSPFNPMSLRGRVLWASPAICDVRTLNANFANPVSDQHLPDANQTVVGTAEMRPGTDLLVFDQVEVREATPEDRAEVQTPPDMLRKSRRKRRMSPRRVVQLSLKEIDHAVCGPPCAIMPVDSRIKELNEEFKSLFPEKMPPGLPPQRTTDHRIDIKPGSKIPAQRLYRMSPLEDEELRRQLKEWLDLGIIERANSPYGAGVLFVPKANGKLRMCADYRPLNAITVVDQYPLPRIEELIDQVGKAKFFSKLDLHSGFHQIRVHPDHIPRTAFKTKYGTFQSKVMTFGLCNAPATFQRTMDLLFGDLRDFVGVYMDDVLIFSETSDAHVQDLRTVYDRLAKERLYINGEKCTFAQSEVSYCGFIVGEHGVRPQPEKLAVVHAWPTPKDPGDIRSFLGLCGFYQRFVPDYATIATPLTNLLHKSCTWTWGSEQEKAFATLKQRLLQAPVMIIPDVKQPFLLHTDASEVGIGATLSQTDSAGQLRLVSCMSRKLNPAEKNYPVHEKEMLALVNALEHWRHYLLGAQVQVRTDNSALRYLQKTPRPSARQIRWLEKLQQYTMEIVHIPGRDNAAADALSRLPGRTDMSLMCLRPLLTKICFAGPIVLPPSPVEDWWPDYMADDAIRKQYFRVGTDELQDSLQFHHGRIWRGDKIVVPARRYTEVISQHHDLPHANHWGISRTVALVRRKYLIPNLKELVRYHVRSCDICQKFKTDHHLPRGYIENLDIPEYRWQSLSMDWLTLPAITVEGTLFDEVLTVTDRATKMVHLLATNSQSTAIQTAQLFFEEVVRYHGLPRSIVSDRDPIFTSALWQALCDRFDIKMRLTSPFHPQANGQAERTNQTMKQALRTLQATRPTEHWLSLLTLVEIAINNAPIATTEYSPYYLNYGFHPVFHFDLPDAKPPPSDRRLEPLSRFLVRMQTDWEAIAKVFQANQQRTSRFANQRRLDYQFTVGQQVLVSQRHHYRSQLGPSGPLAPKAVGPFTIVRQITRNTFELDIPAATLGRASPVFHSSNLIPYESRLLDPDAASELPPMDPEDHAEHAAAHQPQPPQQPNVPVVDLTDDPELPLSKPNSANDSNQPQLLVPRGDLGDVLDADPALLPLPHAPDDLDWLPAPPITPAVTTHSPTPDFDPYTDLASSPTSSTAIPDPPAAPSTSTDNLDEDMPDPIPPHLRRILSRLSQPLPPTPPIPNITTLVQQASRPPHSFSTLSPRVHFADTLQVHLFEPTVLESAPVGEPSELVPPCEPDNLIPVGEFGEPVFQGEPFLQDDTIPQHIQLKKVANPSRTPAFAPEEDVMLKPEVFDWACATLECNPKIDLFASANHKQLPIYITIDPTDVRSIGVNAFNFEWDSKFTLYANPPWSLIDMVLTKIKRERSRVLLVTPNWPHMSWWGKLEKMTEKFAIYHHPLYLDDQGVLRPKPLWDTRFSLVQG